MYLAPFHTSHKTANGQVIHITPEQGSTFAKGISDDFNPLHNPDSKRFCVPGDLLFSLILAYQGLSQKMSFHYTGMIGKNVAVTIPNTDESELSVIDENDKSCLEASRQGDITHDTTLIEAFSRAYVAFSGHCFPHILVPLMKQHNVMINPSRPMVIYESMAFEFEQLNCSQPILELKESTLEVQGKRGQVRIEFTILEAGKQIGSGFKTMVLSGLREYDQEQIDDIVRRYEQSKVEYNANL
ncbi:MAG: DUF3581 domain-containing protein [Thiomicrorhabdus sp.]|nr:DUF3581 domain-containing protein [Thiomicrorhabdus sp.]MCF6299190.1 DUF3581 domain-containing protein [Thiomicrorhabdus sp.]